MRVVDAVATGANLKSMMKQKGITTKALYTNLGLTSPNVCYRWYKGECLPRIDNLVMIASMADCSINDIVRVKDVR